MKRINEFMESTMKRIAEMQQDKIRECFERSDENIDYFSDCFQPYLTKLEAIEKPL